MEIQEIKARLSIETILKHYNLSLDRHHKTCCPFHKEMTPSFTVYPETNTFHCFGCGVSGDAIELIQLKENLSKHEAILKAQDFLGELSGIKEPGIKAEPTGEPAKELSRLAVMGKILQDSRANFKRTDKPQEYIKSRRLDPNKLEIGYIATNFGREWNSLLKESALKLGILKQTQQDNLVPKFTHCVVFFTRNEKGQAVDLYGRSIVARPGNETGKHFYLNGHHQGIYPSYPKADTRKLILTECIIDCASLQQIEAITSQYALIALFGVNGLTLEIEEAIRGLKELEEIVLFFDGDKAGKEAVNRTGQRLQVLRQ